jgi:hypothetical protein
MVLGHRILMRGRRKGRVEPNAGRRFLRRGDEEWKMGTGSEAEVGAVADLCDDELFSSPTP